MKAKKKKKKSHKPHVPKFCSSSKQSFLLRIFFLGSDTIAHTVIHKCHQVALSKKSSLWSPGVGQVHYHVYVLTLSVKVTLCSALHKTGIILPVNIAAGLFLRISLFDQSEERCLLLLSLLDTITRERMHHTYAHIFPWSSLFYTSSMLQIIIHMIVAVVHLLNKWWRTNTADITSRLCLWWFSVTAELLTSSSFLALVSFGNLSLSSVFLDGIFPNSPSLG